MQPARLLAPALVLALTLGVLACRSPGTPTEAQSDASTRARAGDAATARDPREANAWFADGRRAVARAARFIEGEPPAKNVILFVGDGMGVSTVTAARILEGQRRGKSGEENRLVFETLPHLALAISTTQSFGRYPDSRSSYFRVFPSCDSDIRRFRLGYSSGAAPDSHRIPFQISVKRI